MKISINFKAGDPWSYCGRRYRFECEMGNGCLFFRDEGTLSPLQVEDEDGEWRAPTIEWALEALARGDLKLERDLLAPSTLSRARLQEIDPETAYAKDPKAELRFRVLRALDQMAKIPRTEKAFRIAIAKIWASDERLAAKFPQKPGARTVRRWSVTRGEPGERRLNQMVSLAGRVPRQSRLAPEVHAIMQEAALWYWSSRRWSIGDGYARCRQALAELNSYRVARGEQPIDAPSSEIFRRTVRKLECHDTVRGKFGAQVANTRFKACGKGLTATRILQIGEMDHTTIDGVIVIDEDYKLPAGRPYLTAIADVFSGCIVGFFVSFEPPSVFSVIECIKRANRPKINLPSCAEPYPILAYIFGRFDELVVDNGREFAGVAMQDSLADAGISLRLAPIGTPTHKGKVERFFETLNTLLLHKLPGGVFKPELLREFGYDPRKDAAITLAQLEDLIWQALVLHHIRPPEGEPLPRALVWQKSAELNPIEVLGNDDQLNKMLGKVAERCVVSRSGVSLFGLNYHDPGKVGGLLEDLAPLEPIRGRRKGSASARVKVKYNPENLAEVHVWNKVTGCYVTLPCTDEKYAGGVSLWHHQKLQEWSKQQGFEFSTEEDRLRVQAQMNAKLEECGPKLKGKELRTFARLSNSAAVKSKLNADVALAYALPRHDGLAPVIVEHETMAAARSDGGQKPSRPARGKKPKPALPRRNTSIGSVTRSEQREQPLDFSVDVSAWKEVEL